MNTATLSYRSIIRIALAHAIRNHITVPLCGAVIIVFSCMPFAVFAATSDIGKIITNTQEVVTILLRLVMTLAFVVFVWGIVKFIAASGNPQKIAQAKTIMLYGIIGLAIMASIGGIIAFLQAYFGTPGGIPIKIPQF